METQPAGTPTLHTAEARKGSSVSTIVPAQHGSPSPGIIKPFLDKLFVPRFGKLETKIVLWHFLF